jgi:hypothetical protein
MVYAENGKLWASGSDDDRSEASPEQDEVDESIEEETTLETPDEFTQMPASGKKNLVADTAVWALSEQQIREATKIFTGYLRQERERYYSLGNPLKPEIKGFFERFFEPALLGQIRVHTLAGTRISNPPFYQQAHAMGLRNLPDITHQTSLTFLDVLVFNERLTERTLFHALVHAVQFQVLGVERYAPLFLQGFLRTRSYFMIPMKAHAFALDCRFAENRTRGFCVETEIVHAVEAGQY